ncbi:MAG: GGDEF domain-containing protein [Campylobacterales bacterium]|nr:GGDEF domain-containing protein [Campylobacterales bacterium]
MTIQSIIKNSIKRLELENKLLTPDFYAEAFCKEAAKAGMKVEDCHQLDKFTQTLHKDFQKELTQYRITTMNELVRFLISKLNRTNQHHCAEMLEGQIMFTKRVLQVVEVLHNKEASELAKKSIEMLAQNPTIAQIEQFRQLWINFITTYNDTFLQKLSSLGRVDSGNLKESIENLRIPAVSAADTFDNLDLAKISSLLVSSLVPSIASSFNEDIANISKKIKDNPSVLGSGSIINEIKAAITLRIALDKDSLKEMVESIDGVLDKLSLRLIDMIEKSENSTIEIRKIKDELEAYSGESTKNFTLSHKKLFTIALALEENTQLLSSDLRGHSEEISILSQRVHQLENELKTAQEESKEDFLTKLYNKRALDDFINIKESEFERYGHNFSVVMFDIDYFKAVNDTFGHDAGDAVLFAFAKILKQEGRIEDIIGRFGGEEFMAILSETDTEGGVIFAEKVRKHVEQAKFMYRDQRISVTVSAGVSERKQHSSLNVTLKSADEYLYSAKKDGRNRVAYKK